VARTAGEGSLRPDGRRAALHPADVAGRFTRGRRRAFVVLIAIYVALPWIPIGGAPAVFLDVEHRLFHLFGRTFDAQDLWRLLFLIIGLGLGLLLVTALAGRVWCGWACPQTVFLEGVYRRIERWIDGPSLVRIRLASRRWDRDKLLRRIAKQAAFAAVSLAVAHIFLSYFVSLPRLWRMVGEGPAAHPQAFGWAMAVSLAIHANFAWFREQLCVIVCPYGRLQSALIDRDSLIVGYDVGRGEPRGKVSAAGAGDCVDCGRCVAVCPTGIDIRNGLQLDCVACAACVDACDDVMGKLGRPAGLVRYASLRTLGGGARRILRPRVAAYAGLGLAVAVSGALAFRADAPFEAGLLRQRGAPYALEGAIVQNGFEVRVVNKRDVKARVTIAPRARPGTEWIVATPSFELAPLEHRTVPVFARSDRGAWRPGDRAEIEVVLGGTARILTAPLLGPAARP
jgi:cytochrome c oxidase accessory protein FixG